MKILMNSKYLGVSGCLTNLPWSESDELFDSEFLAIGIEPNTPLWLSRSTCPTSSSQDLAINGIYCGGDMLLLCQTHLMITLLIKLYQKTITTIWQGTIILITWLTSYQLLKQREAGIVTCQHVAFGFTKSTS